MDAQLDEKALEAELAETLGALMPEAPHTVSEDEFVGIVAEALEAVAGTMLFKMRIGADEAGEYVAAASVGDDGERRFLLLTLPLAGGPLKVEPASGSANPVAAIAPAYAGLMDVFRAAA